MERSSGENGEAKPARIVVLGTGFAGSAFLESFNRNLKAKAHGRVELTAINHCGIVFDLS